MPQSYASLNCHIIFSTKDREPWLTPDIQSRLFPFMGSVLQQRKSPLLAAGGVADHVHLLMSLSREEAISDLLRELKAVSSRWFHDTFRRAAFAWQTGYGAFAVSVTNIPKVKTYIASQAEHHRHVTFREEFERFLRGHAIEFDPKHLEA